MKKLLSLLFAALLTSVAAFAADAADKPIISFHTNLYDLQGELNSFTFLIGATEPTTIEVDCGNGRQKYNVKVADIGSGGALTGTVITCNVTSAGNVNIYGDASKIDVFDAEGAYISRLDLGDCVNLDILNLNHNQLEGLDLSKYTKLRAIYISDNEFTAATPLVVGPNHPDLTILEMAVVDYLEPTFDIGNYPRLSSFVAYSNKCLRQLDPTRCPGLLQLSIDSTPVSSLDVSKCPNLLILNISETRIPSIDISANKNLTEFYASRTAVSGDQYKLRTIDMTKNPELQRVCLNSNLLTELDVTGNPKLSYLAISHCYLSSIDLSKCTRLQELNIDGNDMSFATLPWPNFETYMYQPRNMAVDHQQKVGTTLDLSDKLLRAETVTTAKLYGFSEKTGQATELDQTFYTYADGRLTLNRAYADSVYAEFSNTVFSEWPMRTVKFKVKGAADYGKPSKSISFGTYLDAGRTFRMTLGIPGASASKPKTVYIDGGDGKQTAYTVTGSTDYITVNRTGSGYVTLYLEEGDVVTAFALSGIELTSIDLTPATELQHLILADTKLTEIDLSMNRHLQTLNLKGNSLTTLTLEGVNGNYSKSNLWQINVADNLLTDITLNDRRAIRSLILQGNRLTELSLKNFDYIETLNLKGNALTTADLSYMTNALYVDLSDNALSELILPETNKLSRLDISGNRFTFVNLPIVTGTGLTYLYAPQGEVSVPTKAPGVDLTAQAKAADGSATTFTLHDQSGAALTLGTDFTCDGGRISFLAPAVGKKVYVAMTNPAFPDFKGADALRTTLVDASEFPTNCIAEFVTPTGGQRAALSFAAAAKAGTALYIDWAGQQKDLAQYILTDTYTRFEATTVAGARVKVYTYSPEEKITVFSISDVTMSEMDASRMTDLIAFTVNNTALADGKLKLPASPALRELSLSGNSFTKLDPAGLGAITSLSIDHNKLTTFDMTPYPALEWLVLSHNSLTDVTLKGSNIIQIDLNNNLLESVDFSGVPALPQLSLSGNKLRTIDVSMLSRLIMLNIDHNYFTFPTLPPVLPQYVIYNYNSQANLTASCVDGKVDFSSQATAGGQSTVYRWYVGQPTFDENGALVGEELVRGWGEEYVEEGGITTFLTDLDGVQCVMTNPAWPQLYLRSDLMDVYFDPAGVTDIEDDSAAPVEYYDLRGIRVANPAAGIYLRRQGTKVTKVLVK